MRHFMWAAGVLAIGLLIASPADGQPPSGTDPKAERIIHATGTGTVSVKPDMVRISFGVMNGSGSVKDCRAENEKGAKKVMDAIAELKIEGLEVKMVQGEMRPVKQGANFGGIGGVPGGELVPPISGYRVTAGFTVVYKDKDAAKLREVGNKVLDAALDAGANADASGTVNDNWRLALGDSGSTGSMIEYSRQDMVEPQRQALSKAVEDALLNAKALAGGAKVNITDTVGIGDLAVPGGGGVDVTNWMSQILGQGAGTAARSTGTFTTRVTSDGDVEVTCRVNVKCRY